MKKTKPWLAVALATVIGAGVVLPTTAQAADIQPQRFDMYFNTMPVTMQHSLLYQGNTYVQLRELAAMANMEVEYIAEEGSWLMNGGPVPRGIHVYQPSFIYVKDDVRDYRRVYNNGEPFQGVDISMLYEKYDTRRHPDLTYSFSESSLVIRAADGETHIPFTSVYSSRRTYVPVAEYREKIQPYMVDICMQ